jgi:hypothetical protein
MPTHQYLREYEKQWNTFSGMPVYPNYRGDLHIARRTILPHMGLPMLVGWDFGLTPAAVVCQLQGDSLKVIREYVSKNEGIKTFSPTVMNDLKMHYPEWEPKDYFHFIDPAGFQRAQTDARTCAQEMQESAPIMNLSPGPIDWETRRSSVEEWLMKVKRDCAGLEMDPDNCPSIIEGFAGGYRYPDSQSDIESAKPRPIKNSYSHPHDALQYVTWGAIQKKSSGAYTEIALPSYGFAKETPKNSQGGSDYGRIIKRSF